MNKKLLKVEEVAEIIGLGRTKTYQLISSGEIPSIVIPGSRSRRIPVEQLDRWIREQSSNETEDPS